jgi:carbon-monoxide dehydrogenase large subunit
MAKFGIGQAVTRREDTRLVTGTGCYVDDLVLPNAAYVAFLRSPHAHAKLGAIDVTAARAAPGVLAVLTGAELVQAGVQPFPIPPGMARADGKPMSTPPGYPLAVGTARFVGEAVAAVVAQTKFQAEDAAELIAVDYEALPAVPNIQSALAQGAPELWADAPGNITAQIAWGDKAKCDAGFAAATLVTRLRFYNQRLVPHSMEPRGCAADPSGGRLTLHLSCQNPSGARDTLAAVLPMVPKEQLRVRVHDVGGGFGMKTMVYPEDAVCCIAARQLGRPVRWTASRSEEFLASSHGRDQTNDAELAFDAAGKIAGFRVHIDGNVGAYGCSPGALIHLAIGPKVITGVYHVPAFHLTANAILTNTGVVSAYRGAGRPEAIYLIERLMDQAAFELKLDPAELRRRNLIQPGAMPYTNAMGEKFDSGNFPHMLQRMLHLADWDGYAARRSASQQAGKLRGRAISTFLEWTGVVHEESIRLFVEGGRIKVHTAMQAMGQGIETSYVQILAEHLDIDPELIDIVQGDSDIMAGLGSMGSRSLYIGGSAMLTASKQTIDRGRELAGESLEVAGADLVYANGRFSVAGTDLGVGLFDLAAGQPEGRIVIDTKQTVGGPSWPNSCHVCELEVDPDTGAVQLLRYTTLDDVGRVINPMIVAGQVHGGIAQAVGQALLEDTRYDPESGQMLSGSFMDYALPRADDLPNISVHTDESSPCQINPLGAKGVGELGTVGGTPTVINALLDALRPLGVRHIEMPATPERVWRAIRAAKA